MSRTIPAPLLANMQSNAPTLAWGFRILRLDGSLYYFTSHDSNKTVDGNLYLAAPGINWSSLVISAGLAVDNSEITALDDGTIFTRADVMQRRWVNSAFRLFQFNWASPSDGIDVRQVGTLGELTLKRNTIVIELRGLQQYLQQPVGPQSQKTCRNQLGVDDGIHSFCDVDLGPFTHSGTVSTATNARQFTDATIAQAEDYFGEGTVEWLTGNNAGTVSIVKSHTAAGVFVLTQPLLLPIQVGDTFEPIAGCRKRKLEDCRDKFDNILRFNAEADRPTPAEVLQPAEP